MSTEKFSERVTVPLAPDTAEQLRRLARRDEVSLAAIVRRAVRLLLAGEGSEWRFQDGP